MDDKKVKIMVPLTKTLWILILYFSKLMSVNVESNRLLWSTWLRIRVSINNKIKKCIDSNLVHVL